MNGKAHSIPYTPKPLSRQLAQRISALEGLYVSAEMQSKFTNFDVQKLTGNERRAQLFAQFKNT